MSDFELISLKLTSGFMSLDIENDLFRKLPTAISSIIERSVYNRRKRKLVNQLNSTRLKLTSYFNEFEDYFIVDSMPLEVCEFSRSSRSKICRETDCCYSDREFCASKKHKIL